MKIGDLARLTGTRVETIRFYEKEGLLPAPGRSSGTSGVKRGGGGRALGPVLRQGAAVTQAATAKPLARSNAIQNIAISR